MDDKYENTGKWILIILLLPFFFLIGCKTSHQLSSTTNIPPSASTKTTADVLVNTSDPSLTMQQDPYLKERTEMVRHQIEARGIHDPLVIDAMLKVPRHDFVLNQYLDFAYADSPLPINHGQTISQPFIVAWMTEILDTEASDRVLEIGTGSGYQAAILAEMGLDVYSVEIIPELAEEATERLKRFGYDQVHILNTDGYFGWEEYAPYDAIIVTAAPDHLPQPLIFQLKEGGKLVIPIGPVGAVQTLWLFEKVVGEMEATNLGAVRFVPLTGDH